MAESKHRPAVVRDGSEPAAGRWTMLALVAAALILSRTTWFSAVLPEMQARFRLSPAAASWLTNAVQLGFVVAALAHRRAAESSCSKPVEHVSHARVY